MNILIVDDREDNRYFLEILLKGNGYDVYSVSNGAEALEKLKSERIDLIISDILMPVMDGFELCQKIKTDKALRSIPFIFYTATYTGQQDEEFAKKIGADRFILKPCEPDIFIETVREVLQSGKNNIPDDSSEIQPLPEREILKLYNERLVRKLEQKMEQLEKSEELFKNLFKYHAAVKLIINPDDGSIIDANDAAVKYYGWPYEKITRMKIQDINILTPEEVENAMQKVRDEKRIHFEFKHRRADGSIRDVDVYSSNIKVQGKNLLHSINHDITERKHAEMSLQKTRLQLQLFIEHAPAAIAMFDNDMKYIATSRRFLEDYKLGNIEVAGKSHYELFPDIPDRIKEVYRRCLAGSTERSEEDSFPRSDGRTDWIRWEVRPWYEYSGEIGGLILFSEVITARKEAEKALRESEDRLRHAAEAANFGTYYYNFESGNIYFSPEHLALYGLPSDTTIELDTDLTAKALHPEDRAAFLAAMTEANKPEGTTSGILDIEYRIFHTDGQIRWLRARGLTIFDKSGHPVRADGIVQDTTERKKAEEKIKKLSRIYAVLSEINKAIVKINDQQVLFETACKIAVETGGFRFCWIGLADIEHDCVTPVAQCGFSEGFLETISISISPDNPESYGPAGTAVREKKYNVCNDTENDKRILPWREEVLKRGYLSTAGFPLFMSGNIYGTIVFNSTQVNFFDNEEISLLEELSSDLSYCVEMLNNEKQKQQAEKERDRFFNYSIDMMCIIGFDGYFRQLNPAWGKTLGWTNEELMAKPFIKMVHSEDRKSTLEIGKRLMKDEHAIMNDLNRIICADGAYKWLSWDLVTLPNEKNIFAVARDITATIENDKKQKSLEAQLIQAQKLESLGTMAGGIAHDFNNILNIVMGYASILKLPDIKNDEVLKNAEIILDASKRGAALVKQLLTFARKGEAAFQSLEINDTIIEIQKLLKETFPKTIVINSELQENLPPITGDSTQIHQILLNLCVNARDAMQNEGNLTITTKRLDSEALKPKKPDIEPGEYIEIKVRDTGTGMDETVIKKIFDPFFTTKEKGKGTGLGLALVYGIVKNHGGFIDLTSEVGRGTTFYIYLPAQMRSEEFYKEPLLNEENIPQGTGTILLIEDEKLDSELLTTLLVLKGYKVITAYDGLQGITAYQNHMSEISVVISDIGLPRLGGEEVFKQIKAVNPEVKFILISGFIDPEVKARLQEDGVLQFVQKPYMPDEILWTIKRVIEEELQ